MKSAGKAPSYELYRHIRKPKEIIRNLLNDSYNIQMETNPVFRIASIFIRTDIRG